MKFTTPFVYFLQQRVHGQLFTALGSFIIQSSSNNFILKPFYNIVFLLLQIYIYQN